MMDNSCPQPAVLLPSRNDILGFAERTRRNLDFIRAAHEEGGRDVHVVTQAVLSLLGIVVFPYEQYFKYMQLDHKLRELEVEGWPRWSQTGWAATSLQHLLRRLRNATAHSNIYFDSDSDRPADVRMVFRCAFENGQTWEGEISAPALLEFCEHFLTYVENHFG